MARDRHIDDLLGPMLDQLESKLKELQVNYSDLQIVSECAQSSTKSMNGLNRSMVLNAKMASFTDAPSRQSINSPPTGPSSYETPNHRVNDYTQRSYHTEGNNGSPGAVPTMRTPVPPQSRYQQPARTLGNNQLHSQSHSQSHFTPKRLPSVPEHEKHALPLSVADATIQRLQHTSRLQRPTTFSRFS